MAGADQSAAAKPDAQWGLLCRPQGRWADHAPSLDSRCGLMACRRAPHVAEDQRLAENQVVTKPNAKEMVSALHPTDILGVDLALPGVRSSATRGGSLYDFVAGVKQKHPRKIILTRVGEFYETMGFDAVVMVEFAHLNRMGSGVPKAGCPVQNLKHTMRSLLDAGFSVVVCEELPSEKQRGAKKRFVSGVCTPASPEYIFGRVDESDNEFRIAPPVMGVAASARGMSICEVMPDMRSCTVQDGLTAEAAMARLEAGYSELHVHESVYQMGSEGSKALSSFLEGRAKVKHGGSPPHKAVLRAVEHDLGWGECQWSTRKISTENRPRALHMSTATQVGVSPAPGVPGLVDVLLPRDTPALCRGYVKTLLLTPPPYTVAAALQSACGGLLELDHALPQFLCLHPAKPSRLLSAREANHLVFLELEEMFKAVCAMFAAPALRPIAGDILEATAFHVGYDLDGDDLHENLLLALGEITSVVARPRTGDLRRTCAATPALDRLLDEHEIQFRGRVQRGCSEAVDAAYGGVDAAADRLERAAESAFGPVVRESAAAGEAPSRCANVVYDVATGAVWLKATSAQLEAAAGVVAEEFTAARDGRGKAVDGRWSTPEVAEAVHAYHTAVDRVHTAVVAELRRLAEALEHRLTHVVAAAAFSVIARALDGHTKEAVRRGWVLPRVDWQDDAGAIEVEEIWPYWMDGLGHGTVKNSFALRGMFLLTGPNMAGKSTVQRSTCAAALLATCGLLVPARAARFPRLDTILLRMGSADSPAEGHSSFKMEMLDVRTILDVASPSSLIMVDELGKGTEPDEGAAIAGAVLQDLDGRGCKGIFATHLYAILDLPLAATGNTERVAMGTVVECGRRRPTWTLSPGECRQSLALDVAQDCGVPPPVLQEARRFQEILTEARRTSAGGGDGAGDCAPADVSAEDGRGDEPCASFPDGEGRVAIEELAEVLLRVALPVAGEGARTRVLRPGEVPPTRVVGRSCVYVRMGDGGEVYVGETDDLAGRVEVHRSSWRQKSAPHAGGSSGGGGGVGPTAGDLTFCYLELPDRSCARRVESAAIKQLELEGFNLLSSHDKHHRHFAG